MKENNRGNGAREVGFKPPLTTDKQQQREDAKARRNPPGQALRAQITRNRTDSRLHLGAKYLFSSSPMFCFSRFGTPRAPGNGLCHAIGHPWVRGVVRAFLPGPARALTGAFLRRSRRSDRPYQRSMLVHQLTGASVQMWEEVAQLFAFVLMSKQPCVVLAVYCGQWRGRGLFSSFRNQRIEWCLWPPLSPTASRWPHRSPEAKRGEFRVEPQQETSVRLFRGKEAFIRGLNQCSVVLHHLFHITLVVTACYVHVCLL